ncbi:hypothetical protein GCM10010967_52350 [Dyadobacter beijingensis]|uniref:Glycosyl-4,4'-diaponeurosporenoate acyltransferase n=1 Tax=Dyadobacter beijingensis TaxID=365489 RepID=A0ABQ2IFY8_9BACT|nr:hypothetical protein [Dyadobacter beijingensis]GGN09973.1 hypothetical protein GCM10010967_52350 [Dyadobacter beijingensis]
MFLKWVKIALVILMAAGTTGLMIRYLDMTSGVFSFGINFLLMFWFTVFESQLKPPLDSEYFNAQPFERNGKLYQLFGVEWYRAILVKSGWEKMRQQQTPIRKSLADFRAYERASRVAEAGHIVIGLVVLLITGYVIFAYSFFAARWLIITNIFLNVYPVLLQRYTRPRLQRVIDKMG